MTDEPQYTATDNSNDRKYFIMTPQLVMDRCDDPYEFILWSAVRMIASEGGECYVGTRNLAALCGIGVGTLARARKGLLEKGLLKGRLAAHHGQQKVWHLSIPDLWPENIAWRTKHSSLRERISLKTERLRAVREARSPLEQKKNQLQEEPNTPAENLAETNAATQREADEIFGPKPAPPPRVHKSSERIAADTLAASQRFHARHAGKQDRPALEKALERYGDDAPALRELNEQIETNFGLVPIWENGTKVVQWATGLRDLYYAARGDIPLAIAAGKQLRSASKTISTPHSLVKTAQSMAAERATASTAPTVRASRVFR